MIKKLLGLPIIASVFVLSSANAAPVAIDTMFVESAMATLDLRGTNPPPPVTASATFSPAIDITMGSYQSSIFSMGDVSNLYLNVYSTGAYGMSVPSGYVDGNIISVDFSSLRAQVTYQNVSYGDVALWPLTTTLDYGYYDPLTGDYTVGWSETFRLLLSNNNTLDVSLSGYLLTAVPVPAALWLFGSGMVALLGFASSRKK